jgi:hypothetical protein
MVWITLHHRGYLQLSFRFQDVECREDTCLKDTLKNRKRLQEKAQQIQYEIDHGIFDYRRHFPHTAKACSWDAAAVEMGIDSAVHRMDDVSLVDPPAEKEYLSPEDLVERIPYRPQTIRNLMSQGVLREGTHYFKPTQRKVVFKSYEPFVQESWLPHIRTKVRDMTAREYEAILQVRVFPLTGSILLREFRPEHIDRLINHLRSLKGMRNRPLSSRRINIILLRVRSVLNLAYERGYMEKNPHAWVTLQEEKRPHVDPFSFEEREALLKALPEPEKGFRRACANFWKNYFVVAFDTGLRPSEQLALR